MEFRKYRPGIIIRVIFLLLLGYAGTYIALKTYFWLVSIWIFVAVIALTIELIKHIEKSRTELINFLAAIKQNDFSTHYSEKKGGKKTDELHQAFNILTETFRQLREEKEGQFQYLQIVVEHIDIALICYDQSGNIYLFNKAAGRLFLSGRLTKISEIAKIDPILYDELQKLKSGGRTLVKYAYKNELLNLAIQATEFKLSGKNYKILSFHDIKNELELQELVSWQKLI